MSQQFQGIVVITNTYVLGFHCRGFSKTRARTPTLTTERLIEGCMQTLVLHSLIRAGYCFRERYPAQQCLPTGKPGYNEGNGLESWPSL